MAAQCYVAFLRAINLAGVNRVAMSDLRDLVAKLGFDDARTLLNSGNVVFRSAPKPSDRLEKLLEGETAKRLKVETDFFVRSGNELEELVANNPFKKEAKGDPGHLLVLFLKGAVDAAAVAALQQTITGREVVRGSGRHVYVVYPDGVGRSKLTMAAIEKKLGVRGTGRNWNTVIKLKELACQ